MATKHKMRIEGYRTIPEMDLDLGPGVEGFVGANAQGKTNILMAIQDLRSGGDDPSKIKDGEDKYVLRLSVIDELGCQVATVSRIQTRSGTRLESSGLPAGTTAKAYLDTILDELTLNPVRLLQENPVDYLREHLPVTVEEGDVPSAFQEELKTVFQAGLPKSPFDLAETAAKHIASLRLEVGRQKKQAAAVIDDLRTGLGPEIGRPNLEEDAVRQELAEIKIARDQKAQAETKLREHNDKVTAAQTQLEGIKKDILEKEEKVTALQLEIAGLRDRVRNGENFIVSLKGSAPAAPADQNELAAREATAAKHLQDIEHWKTDRARRDKIRERETERQAIEDRHKRLDEMFKYFEYDYPRKVIERVKLPVQGLEFREKKLFVDGRRLDLLSETERGLVAVKLACAIAKGKGHIAISFDGLEIMDRPHREEFFEVAKASGLKVLYTRQGKPEHSHETEIVKAGA